MPRQEHTLTPALWELGSNLKTLRMDAEQSVAALAVLVGRSQSQVSRWETGHAIPDATDIHAVCDAVGVGAQSREHLLELTTKATEHDGSKLGVGSDLARVVAFQHEATKLVQVAPLMVPGLLQTADYARAVIGSADLSEPAVERRVEARLERRSDLLARGAVFEALLAKRVLTEGPCASDVLRDQLRYLVKLCQEYDNIIVRVVEMNRHSAAMFDGSFTVMWFGERMAPVGHVEVRHYSTLITNSRTVRSLAKDAHINRDHAASKDETVAMMTELAAE